MAVSKVIYNGTTLIDLTGDTIAADKILTGYVGHNNKGERIVGTASASTVPTNGSLIVCHCSSDITSVEAVYNGITAGADLYTSSQLAYITIPHTFTGTVTVNGYAGNVLKTSATVSISAVDKYECQLSTSSLIYGYNSSLRKREYSGIGDHQWLQNGSGSDRTSDVEAAIDDRLLFTGYNYFCSLNPAIHNRGYSKLKLTVEYTSASVAVVAKRTGGAVIGGTPLSGNEITIDIDADENGYFYLCYNCTGHVFAMVTEIKFV